METLQFYVNFCEFDNLAYNIITCLAKLDNFCQNNMNCVFINLLLGDWCEADLMFTET